MQRPEPQHEEDGRRAEQEEARQRALRAGIVAVVVVVVVSIMNATHVLSASARGRAGREDKLGLASTCRNEKWADSIPCL